MRKIKIVLNIRNVKIRRIIISPKNYHIILSCYLISGIQRYKFQINSENARPNKLDTTVTL